MALSEINKTILIGFTYAFMTKQVMANNSGIDKVFGHNYSYFPTAITDLYSNWFVIFLSVAGHSRCNELFNEWAVDPDKLCINTSTLLSQSVSHSSFEVEILISNCSLFSRHEGQFSKAREWCSLVIARSISNVTGKQRALCPRLC